MKTSLKSWEKIRCLRLNICPFVWLLISIVEFNARTLNKNKMCLNATRRLSCDRNESNGFLNTYSNGDYWPQNSTMKMSSGRDSYDRCPFEETLWIVLGEYEERRTTKPIPYLPWMHPDRSTYKQRGNWAKTIRNDRGSLLCAAQQILISNSKFTNPFSCRSNFECNGNAIMLSTLSADRTAIKHHCLSKMTNIYYSKLGKSNRTTTTVARTSPFWDLVPTCFLTWNYERKFVYWSTYRTKASKTRNQNGIDSQQWHITITITIIMIDNKKLSKRPNGTMVHLLSCHCVAGWMANLFQQHRMQPERDRTQSPYGSRE